MNIVKPEWEEFQSKINSDELNLRDETIMGTMFQSDPALFEKEFNYILSNNKSYLELIKSPNQYGSPLLFKLNNETYNPNDVHHLYHICRRENSMGKPNEPVNVIEWGGGYGNMCKVFYLVYADLIESYTIIDLPKLSKLAKTYVSKTCKNKNVTHLSVEDFKEKLKDKYDFFISTWALSESPSMWTDYMVSNSFLGCDNFLISLHQCGQHIPFMNESTRLRAELKSFNITEEEVLVISGINYYFFK
jgi:hypothetical protein